MDNHWTKPHPKPEGIIQTHSRGDRLVSGNNSKSDTNGQATFTRTNTLSDLTSLMSELPEYIQTYVHECLQEHSQAICNILALGYEGEELFFRDFLSGPRNEIASHELNVLQEAFADVRYELVPTILFANRNLENPEDDVAETSSLVIEFHKRGMAF